MTQQTYTLEIIAELTGTDTKTILTYQEMGVIQPEPETNQFTDDTVRHLSRIQQLRQTHTLTESATKLVADLLTEVEDLRQKTRQSWR